MKKAIVVCSGGLDSTTAAYCAKFRDGCDTTLIHFNYRHLAEESESKAVKRIARHGKFKLIEQDLDWLGNLGDSPLTDKKIKLPLGDIAQNTIACWVPARNLVMYSIAAAYADAWKIDYIYAGVNKQESVYPDHSVEYHKAFENVLKGGCRYKVKLRMPLIHLMKPQELKLGLKLGVPYQHTWSCDYSNDKDLRCGKCGCCCTTRAAWEKIGKPFPGKWIKEK